MGAYRKQIWVISWISPNFRYYIPSVYDQNNSLPPNHKEMGLFSILISTLTLTKQHISLEWDDES